MNHRPGTRARHLATASASLLLAGCQPERVELTVPELPGGPGYAGLVYRGPGDRWTGTGLSRGDGAQLALEVAEPGADFDELTLVYFSEATLRRLTSLDDAALRDLPLLRPASNRAGVRPDFSASGARDAERPVLTTDMEPLSVAATWTGACPRLLGEAPSPVEIRCGSSQSCPTTARQVGCELVFESAACPYSARAVIDGFGRTEINLGTALGRCSLGSAREDPLRLRCEGGPESVFAYSCELVVRVEPDPVPAPDLQSRLLFPPGRANEPDRALRMYGPIVETDRVLVTRPELDPARPDAGCDELPVELLSLDPETLETLSSAPLERCLIALSSSNRPGEFYSAHEGTARSVRRWRTDGTLLASAELLSAWRDGPLSGPELVFDETTRTLAVRGETVDPSGRNWSVIVFLDGETLTPKLEPFEFESGGAAFWRNGPGELGILERKIRVHLLDLETGRSRVLVDYFGICAPPLSFDINPLGEGRFIFLSHYVDGGLTDARASPPTCSFATPLDRVGSPYRAVRWPQDPSRLLVALARRERRGVLTREAFLAFYSLEEERYLNFSLEIGLGGIGGLEPHPSGAVFGLLHSEGRVTRVRPAGP